MADVLLTKVPMYLRAQLSDSGDGELPKVTPHLGEITMRQLSESRDTCVLILPRAKSILIVEKIKVGATVDAMKIKNTAA